MTTRVVIHASGHPVKVKVRMDAAEGQYHTVHTLLPPDSGVHEFWIWGTQTIKICEHIPEPETQKEP